jgi:hypothetical protein
MNYSRAVILGFSLYSSVTYIMSGQFIPLLVSIAAFVLCEVVEIHRIAASRLDAANKRAEANEETIKKLVEAGLRMEAKINEIEAKTTSTALERYAAVKR